MKKIIISLILLSICKIDFGQIADSLNTWNYLNILIPTSGCKSPNCSGKFYENYYLQVAGDTIIHNKTYKKILSVSEKTNQSYISGYLREEDNNKKVYALFDQLDDSTEVLLYDFTIEKDSIFNSSYTLFANVGGEIEAFYRTFFKSKVINIDSIEYSGAKRLRIKFEETTTNWIGDEPVEDTITWIEGIGSLQGLLNYNERGTSLLCFKHDYHIMYFNTYGLDCNYAGPLDYVETKENPETTIYPNPFKSNVTVKSLKQIRQIIIYNMSGEKLYQSNPMRDVFQLDLNGLERGLYIIKVDNDYKKLVKE